MGITATKAIHNRVPIDPHNVAQCVEAVRLAAVAAIITSPFWLHALLFTFSDQTSSFICVPLLAIVGAAVALYFTQTDYYLRRLMMTGLITHMAASSAFLWVAYFIYYGAVDAFHYWTIGL